MTSDDRFSWNYKPKAQRLETVGGMRKLKHRGGERVNWQFLFTAAAYNLVRMRTLMTTA